MNVSSLESKPVWLEHDRPQFQSLQGPATFDVAVIGGGICGLTTAYLLKHAGKRVAVFEKGRICGGDTGHTTAHLVYVTDQRLRWLSRTFGEEAARKVWQGGRMAIDLVEEIVMRHSIDCGFERVSAYVHESFSQAQEEEQHLHEEADLAVHLGFDAVYRDRIPLGDRPGVEFRNQALFHPVAYLSALAKLIPGDGSEIFEHSEMTEAKDGHPSIRVNGHEVQIDRLIIATHVPLTGLNGLISAMALQTKLFGYSTYVVGGRVPEGTLPHASYNDTEDPYHYLRVSRQNGGDYVIFGGEDHKTGKVGDIETRYAKLEQKLLKLVPSAVVDHRWSGQVIETNDGLPYIGPSNEHQFVATGFAGNGMTFGTLAAMMATDWVNQRENEMSHLYRLGRTTIFGGAWDYLKENKDYPLELIKGYLKRAPADPVASVGPGEGKVLMLDGERTAVSRSHDGKVTSCSAICTHMGCVVKWNAGEQTWDCPCHGSRFAPDGEVLAGPAEAPLKPIQSAAHEEKTEVASH